MCYSYSVDDPRNTGLYLVVLLCCSNVLQVINMYVRMCAYSICIVCIHMYTLNRIWILPPRNLKVTCMSHTLYVHTRLSHSCYMPVPWVLIWHACYSDGNMHIACIQHECWGNMHGTVMVYSYRSCNMNVTCMYNIKYHNENWSLGKGLLIQS